MCDGNSGTKPETNSFDFLETKKQDEQISRPPTPQHWNFQCTALFFPVSLPSISWHCLVIYFISSATRLDNPSSFNTHLWGRETWNPIRRESSGWRHVYSIRWWFIWSGMCNLHQKWKDNCFQFLFARETYRLFFLLFSALVGGCWSWQHATRFLNNIRSTAPDVQKPIITASILVGQFTSTTGR